MSTNATISNKPADVFKTFPEFTKLTLADRGKYELLVRDYPPLADLAFPTLMLVWNVLDSCSVARFGDNLIISYWFPGVDNFSGLSVVGTHNVDETLCALFDHMRANGEKPKAVHVPEFVFNGIRHPELFVSKPEREFDEYIYKLSSFCPIAKVDPFRRAHIKQFITNVTEEAIVVKSIDLSDESNRATLLKYGEMWQTTGNKDDKVKIEQELLKTALDNYNVLGIENICVFVDGNLQAFCLYHRSRDGRYAILTNARINTDIPRTLDYAIYAFAQRMTDQGVFFLNLEYDLGSKFMRTFKLSLGPTDFFRKYTIEPAN